MEEKEGLDVDVEISGAFSNQLSTSPPHHHHPLQTMIISMKMLTNSSILILKTLFQFNDEKIWIFTTTKKD